MRHHGGHCYSTQYRVSVSQNLTSVERDIIIGLKKNSKKMLETFQINLGSHKDYNIKKCIFKMDFNTKYYKYKL